MGKQFSYFVSPDDQAEFEKVCRSSGDIAFLKIWPRSPQPEEVVNTIVSEMGNEILDLWVARREDLPSIEFRRIQGRDVFSCDPTFAPVVEFSRCYITPRYIRASRLYRVDKYWNKEGVLVNKPQPFIDWADRLYKLAKASLTKVEQGYFAGANALKLRQSGVAFEGLDIEIGSIKD